MSAMVLTLDDLRNLDEHERLEDRLRAAMEFAKAYMRVYMTTQHHPTVVEEAEVMRLAQHFLKRALP